MFKKIAAAGIALAGALMVGTEAVEANHVIYATKDNRFAITDVAGTNFWVYSVGDWIGETEDIYFYSQNQVTGAECFGEIDAVEMLVPDVELTFFFDYESAFYGCPNAGESITYDLYEF